MSDFYILDENGEPVPCPEAVQWAQWKETHYDDWRLGYSEFPGEVYVSTVFLGIDHNFTMKGDPILWETMIFNLPGDEYEYQERYRSKEEAEEGHDRAVRYVMERLRHGNKT